MSCCGKGIRVLHGHISNIIGAKKELAEKRMSVCKSCSEVTWFTIGEFFLWQMKHRQLRNLPFQPEHENAGMFCRKCGCYLPAKARVLKETCELGKWKGIEQ